MIAGMSSQTGRQIVNCVGVDDDALSHAIAWLTDAAKKLGKTAIIVTHSKDSAENLKRVLGDQVTRVLVSGQSARINGVAVSLATMTRPLPVSLRNHVVLAIWLDDQALTKLDDAAPAAICFVPWAEGDGSLWKTTWRPTDLRTGSPVPAASPGNPVVEEALRSLTLTVNLSTGLNHPSDREKAIEMFRLLKNAGEAFDPVAVRAWAANNRWSSTGADELAEVAAGVLAGKRYRTSGQWFRSQIIDDWRKRASGKQG